MKLQPPRGMRDLGPQEAKLAHWVVGRLVDLAASYGYLRVETPVLEYEDLFTVKSGDAIIEQIYSLTDKSGRALALKPDITPALTRYFVEKCQSTPRPVRLSTADRVYRYEAPQAGRYREIRQFNAEQFGGQGVACDAETIAHFARCYSAIGLDNVEVMLGDRRILTAAIHRLLDCAEAHVTNAVRILDKSDKIPAGELTQELLTNVPIGGSSSLDKLVEFAYVRGPILDALETIEEFLPPDLVDYWNRLASMLKIQGAYDKCVFRPGLARGSDYYTGLLMEAVVSGKGLIGAVGGGGRYDDLPVAYGAQPMPCVGFSVGIDRVVLLLLEREPENATRLGAVIGATSEGGIEPALTLSGQLREAGVSVELMYQVRPARKHEEFARRREATHLVLIDSPDKPARLVTVADRNSAEVGLSDVVDAIVSERD